jgi:hypothetical protein
MKMREVFRTRVVEVRLREIGPGYPVSQLEIQSLMTFSSKMGSVH